MASVKRVVRSCPPFFFKENKKLWAVTYISHICLAVGGVGSLPVGQLFFVEEGWRPEPCTEEVGLTTGWTKSPYAQQPCPSPLVPS